MSVYLIRHGDYDHRRSAVSGKASDFGLTTLGRQQVSLLRDRLLKTGEIKPDVVYCSTLPRARETADMLSAALGCVAVPNENLCEWCNGNDAIGLEAFMKTWHALPQSARADHRTAPEFESATDFGRRVRSELDRLINLHQGKTVVLIVHAGVIESAFGYFVALPHHHFMGAYPAAAQTSISLWRQSPERQEWVQVFSNDAAHLRQAGL